MIMKPRQHIEHMQTKDNQANARRAEQATDNWMDKSTYEFAAISVLAPLESSRRFQSFYKVEDGHLLWTDCFKGSRITTGCRNGTVGKLSKISIVL